MTTRPVFKPCLPTTGNGIFDAFQAGLLLLASDGKIDWCNQVFSDMLQLPTTQIIGHPLKDFVPAVDQTALNRLKTDPRKDGSNVLERRTLSLQTGLGAAKIIDLYIIDPPQSAGFDPDLTALVVFDITTTRETTVVGYSNHEVLRLALQGNQIGTWCHHARTDTFDLDDTAEQIFGYAPGTCPRRTFTQHLAAHPRQHVDADTQTMVDRLSKKPTNDRGDDTLSTKICLIQTADGSHSWVRISTRKISQPAHLGGDIALGTIQNIDTEVAAFIKLSEAERAQARSNMLTEAATEAAGVGMWHVDPHTRKTWFSDSWFQALGYEKGDWESTFDTFTALLHPDDNKRLLEHLEADLKNGNERYAADFRLRKKDGSYAWIGSAGRLVKGNDGPESNVLVGVQIDISDRVEAKQKLEKIAGDAQEAARRLEHLTENVPGGIYEFHITPTGTITFPFHSNGFATFMGTTPEQIAQDGQLVFQHIHPDDAPRLNQSIMQSLETLDVWKSTVRLNHPTYGLRWIRGTSTPVREDDGSTRWYGYLLDVTEEVMREKSLEQAQKRTQEQALRDPLTNLPNRRAFDSEMMARYSDRRVKNQHHTIIRIDLDNFKLVNDTLGHAAGDAVLCHVADILRQNVRNTDLSARVGGDEFVVFLATGKRTEDATEIVKRVQAEITKPFLFENKHCRYNASFGIASCDALPSDPGELLSFADAAMYEAKNAGRGRVMVFTPELHNSILWTRRRADQIHAALEKEEFEPYFQPQIDSVSGDVTGVEVLARWFHPDEGMVPPDDFLPIAEQIRVVQDIDRMIFDKAIGTLGRLRANNIHLPKISFNVSAGRVLDPQIIESISDLTTQGTKVAFELLESILLEEEGPLFGKHLALLKENNIEIEVDDFGSGHASIIGVMKVAPDTLKIDKRLIVPMVEDPAIQGLVGAIVDIGRTLNIDVTAEGVESLQHARLLRDLGCKTLQGYVFARPMPEPDLVKFMTSDRIRDW